MSYWRSEYDDGWWTFYKDGIEIKLDNLNFGDLIVDEINNANQRIAELESKQRWISVKERLPEDSTMVLFTDGVTKGIGKFSEDGFYDYWYDGFFNKPVTHWMPLPESPNDTQTDTFVYGKDSKPIPDEPGVKK
jgi:hypothetical protein